MNTRYDVAIIGCGEAGIFAGYELKKLRPELNVLVMDQPTNHLDLESITAVNNGLIDFKGVVLFASHDHEFTQTVANRIIEILPEGGTFDRVTTYDEYLEMRG